MNANEVKKSGDGLLLMEGLLLVDGFELSNDTLLEIDKRIRADFLALLSKIFSLSPSDANMDFSLERFGENFIGRVSIYSSKKNFSAHREEKSLEALIKELDRELKEQIMVWKDNRWKEYGHR